ncbi:MAG: hypothetical protein AAF419_03325 [Pseudomonadota bacterium]
MSKTIYKIWLIVIGFLACSASLLANNLPDPTKPADYRVALPEPVYVEQVTEGKDISWRVSAIRISSSDRTAIVNGELVRIGDEINASEVLEINPLSVVINHNDQKLIVRLLSSTVKKQAAN